MRNKKLILIAVGTAALSGFYLAYKKWETRKQLPIALIQSDVKERTGNNAPKAPKTDRDRVILAALQQVGVTVAYDGSYSQLNFPNGDVPIQKGVCCDVIVRAFRAVHIDLQSEVNKDMRANFASYPKKWGLTKPDPNIDHRRVPNLMEFFDRQGKSVAVTTSASDYLPGDVVTWDMGWGHSHIGLVTDLPSDTPGRMLIVHNIGRGTQVEDVLFDWNIIGHYRWFNS